MTDALVRLAAWKLRPGADPLGSVDLVSTNDESRFDEGQVARLHVISGHRDSFETRCPGDALYALLPELRERAAKLRATVPGHSAAARLRPSFWPCPSEPGAARGYRATNCVSIACTS